jgi:hypothetical protein
MTPGARLLAQLQALPPDALLPVAWLLEQLAEEASGPVPAAPLSCDLTVTEFGSRFGRKGSTVRLWCEKGRVPGAFKLREREWRIPAASVELFRQAQGAPAADPPKPTSGDLGDWRRRRRPA